MLFTRLAAPRQRRAVAEVFAAPASLTVPRLLCCGFAPWLQPACNQRWLVVAVHSVHNQFLQHCADSTLRLDQSTRAPFAFFSPATVKTAGGQPGDDGKNLEFTMCCD